MNPTNTRIKRILSLLLCLALSLSLPALAVVGNELKDIEIKSKRNDGAVSFADVEPLILKQVPKLDHLSFVTVSATQGTLYDGYVAEGDPGEGVAGLHDYYRDNVSSASYHIGDILFVPNASYYGKANVSYFAYDTAGNTYTGHILITVEKRDPGISYSSDGEPVRFSSEDVSTYSMMVNGRAIRYVTFTLPKSSVGTLYYNYLGDGIYDSPVSAGTRYYRSETPSINNVSFVPVKGYKGTATVTFDGVDSSGKTLTGNINISVTDHGSAGNADAPFTYYTAPGRSVSFRLSDFTTLCQNRTGYGLDHIQFTSLPASSRGKLYSSNNTSVNINSTYSSSAINNLRFTAATDFEGTVTIPFTGYASGSTSTSRRTFDGTVTIIVSGSENRPLTYTVDPGKRVYFERQDFSDVCYSELGRSLSHIRFTALPSAADGTLYLYNGNTQSRAATATNYYTSQLSNLSFLSTSGFSAPISIPFIGYTSTSSSSSRDFYGEIIITPTGYNAPSREEPGYSIEPITHITYRTTGPVVPFKPSDFSAVSASALGGSPSKIWFISPEGEGGKLCLDFYNPTSYQELNVRQEYSFSDLSRISFLPRAGFSGTITVPYRLSDRTGNSFTGNVTINVTPSGTSSYFNDMEHAAWAAQAADFFYFYGTVQGTEYRVFSPSNPMRRGDFVLMLSRAFRFVENGTSSFPDVPEDSYYASAIAAARSMGVVTGDTFSPKDGITRSDAVLYLYRCMRLAGSATPGSASDLIRFSDRWAVPPAAVEAMGSLVRLGILTGDGAGHLNPEQVLTRAEMVALFHRALTF